MSDADEQRQSKVSVRQNVVSNSAVARNFNTPPECKIIKRQNRSPYIAVGVLNRRSKQEGTATHSVRGIELQRKVFGDQYGHET